ncbi:MAG: TRAP transporter large permease [Oscillospiraceae bacterium]|nr:TRAP transporter large permease [Oscillospiraceae bacterium]
MDPETLSTIILLASLFLLILIRVPIVYAVGISSVLCLISMGQNLVSLPQQMVRGTWSFSLMAIPFFITMGVLMGTGGISKKLIALAESLVGWMRGGLAMVNIVASFFFGGISGSAAADTASLGTIMIPMMEKEGYDSDFSTAVTITSSCEGLLVPPSHNMVIYAMMSGGVSVGALFMAGYIPGGLLAVSLMIGTYILSVKHNYPKGEKFSVKRFLKQLASSVWALLAIIIVVAGVVGGIFTATESAAIAVIYSLIVSVFVYKGITLKEVWKMLDSCIETLGIVLILIAASAAFGICLTLLHIPAKTAALITGISANPVVTILLLNLILLFLGMIMDMAPIILIATPILLPIAQSAGLHTVQFGIMMILNCGIGLLTPPVGSVLFIGSAIAKRPMEKVVKAALPFYVCMIAALLLISFIPAISMWLPEVTGALK